MATSTAASAPSGTSVAIAEHVRALGLEPHPEGGWYRRFYGSDAHPKVVTAGGERLVSTAIHYLLEAGGTSKLHSLRSDELWFWHAGAPLTVVEVVPGADGGTATLQRTAVGPAAFAHCARAGRTFGAYVESGGAAASGAGYALVSCVVTPGFDFADWALADRSAVLAALGPSAPAADVELVRRLTQE